MEKKEETNQAKPVKKPSVVKKEDEKKEEKKDEKKEEPEHQKSVENEQPKPEVKEEVSQPQTNGEESHVEKDELWDHPGSEFL